MHNFGRCSSVCNYNYFTGNFAVASYKAASGFFSFFSCDVIGRAFFLL